MTATTREQKIEQARLATQDGRFWEAVEQYTEVLANSDPQTNDPKEKNSRLKTYPHLA